MELRGEGGSMSRLVYSFQTFLIGRFSTLKGKENINLLILFPHFPLPITPYIHTKNCVPCLLPPLLRFPSSELTKDI